jgi:hypothetical protein
MAVITSKERRHGRGPVATGRIQEEPSDDGITVDKNAAATGSRVFTGLYADLVRQTPVVGDKHPDFPSLSVTRKAIKPTRNGRGRATVTYEGLDPAVTPLDQDIETNPDGNLTTPDESVDVETVEEPIETHPNFAALVAAAGTGPGQATFDEQGLFKGFGPQSGGDLYGQQSYLKARTVTITNSLATKKLDGNTAGTLTSDGQLITKLSSQRFGSVWRNSKEVKTGGWNPLIYG